VRRNRGLPTAGRPYSAQPSKAFSRLAFVDQLELLNNQVRATSRRFRELFVRYPDEAVLLSFPGMNQITAETMLAYMVEHRARFATSDTLEPRPARRQSLGQRPPHTVRFRYAANKPMRHAIDLAGVGLGPRPP
jgi:hypothetical protein